MYIHLVRHKIAFACFNILSIQFLWVQLVHGEPPTNASDYSYIIIIVIGYFYKLCNKHIFITKALGVSFFFWIDGGTGQDNLTSRNFNCIYLLWRLTISIWPEVFFSRSFSLLMIFVGAWKRKHFGVFVCMCSIPPCECGFQTTKIRFLQIIIEYKTKWRFEKRTSHPCAHRIPIRPKTEQKRKSVSKWGSKRKFIYE